jgi:hypothetical protein
LDDGEQGVTEQGERGDEDGAGQHLREVPNGEPIEQVPTEAAESNVRRDRCRTTCQGECPVALAASMTSGGTVCTPA